jgi:hypothetical protein
MGDIPGWENQQKRKEESYSTEPPAAEEADTEAKAKAIANIQPRSGCPWLYTDCNGPHICVSGYYCQAMLNPDNYHAWLNLMQWVKPGKRP